MDVDIGAGRWKSRAATAERNAQAVAICAALTPPASLFVKGVMGPDAVNHFLHFFENTGNRVTIDLERMVQDVTSASTLYKYELSQAMRFVCGLQPGDYAITSGQAAQGDKRGAYCDEDESRNWYFAVGGYAAWGKGRAIVTSKNGKLDFWLSFEYKLFDRYNWDGKKAVVLPVIRQKIHDKFMADFHQMGIAREFNMVGSLKRSIKWRADTGVPTAAVTLGKGR